jgi:PAS domain S-box-containing protein
MKIAAKLRTGYILSTVVIVFTGVVVFVSFQRIHLFNEELNHADTIMEDLFNLNVFANSYLLYRETRPKTQWEIQIRKLDSSLRTNFFHHSGHQTLVVRIRESMHQIDVLFHEIAGASHAADRLGKPLLERYQNQLQSQLMLKLQETFRYSTTLRQQTEDELNNMHRITNWLAVILVFLSALSSILIGHLVGKSIFTPIQTLLKGTQTIGSGKLEFPIVTKRNGEIGELSHSFGKMADKLKIIMVSRDELEQKVRDKTSELMDTNLDLSLEIEERKSTEQELVLAKQEYRTVADFTRDWEYWETPDGTLRYISPSCERVSGYPAAAFQQSASLLRDIIVPADRQIWDRHACDTGAGDRGEAIQFRIRRPDGEICWIEHVCQRVLMHGGIDQGVRVSNRNITKREQYKSEALQLKSDLAHMDRVLTISALTSSLAHEINQPLAAMRSYAQAALRFLGANQPDINNAIKALQGVVSDNKRAADIITRLRTLVQKDTSAWERVDTHSIISEVAVLMNSEMLLRETSFDLKLDADNSSVTGDAIQLQQVLINLITNAMDAMQDFPASRRYITVSTSQEKEDGIHISIVDRGTGIGEDKLETIFQPFQTSKSTGMGLGLGICKSIVEAHGGKLVAENNVGDGATLSFNIPVA